jgi:murein L,D-transpeptidase YcbB/YkuD
MQIIPVVLVVSATLMGSALAQNGAPVTTPARPKAAPIAAAPVAKPGEKSAEKIAEKSAEPLPAIAAISKSPIPTYDESTVQRISAAMLSYSAIEVRGGWPSLPASTTRLAPGQSGPDVVALRQRLAITDDLPAEKIAGDHYDETLAAAVRRFQARHGLTETGTVGQKTLAALNVPVGQRLRQLAASLDRLATMDFGFGQRYVVVNLPGAYAEAVVGDKVVRRYVVVVGKPDRPSPTLTTQITAVNLNPTWTVPLSIAKKDIITRMRKDPGYIGRMHMRVLDGAGNEIDPKAVDWSSDRAPNFTIRQDSGVWNALGAVRIDMPNPHSVYMHDTSHKNFFSNDYRFESSGCTRVAEPRDLAAWVLEDMPGWSRREIDAAIAKGQKLDIRLNHKIPVAWVYLTGWATRDGTVHFRDDIYGHDDKKILMADAAKPIATAARASGFVLQSADPQPIVAEPVSFLDRQ